MPNKRFLITGLFLFFLVLEFLFQTWWNNLFGAHLSPLILLLSGLMGCYLAYLLIGFQENPTIPNKGKQASFIPISIVLMVFFIGAFIVGTYYANIQAAYQVFPGYGSDIIPALQLYVKRFLAGEYPYEVMNIEGYPLYPNYFSMMWLPYCFSELLMIDYRWTAYLIFLIPIFVYSITIALKNIHPIELGFKTAFPFIMLFLLMFYSNAIFGYTTELMPIGLYLILMLSLLHRSPFIMAVGIVLVLLSRYSFSFWLPVYLVIIWVERGFKEVSKVSLWVMVGVLILYVLPFLSKDWETITKGFAYYNQAIEGTWTWRLNEAGRPALLINGYSMAIFFYDFIDGESLHRLTVAKVFHLSISLIVAVLIFLNYLRVRNKGLNVKIYLLIALKLYLVVFYGFFTTPFKYLYHLPLLLSIPILYYLPFNRKREKMLG